MFTIIPAHNHTGNQPVTSGNTTSIIDDELDEDEVSPFEEELAYKLNQLGGRLLSCDIDHITFGHLSEDQEDE